MSSKIATVKDMGTQISQLNPLIKMVEDKKLVIQAIRDGKDLSKLKDIKFVSPI